MKYVSNILSLFKHLEELTSEEVFYNPDSSSNLHRNDEGEGPIVLKNIF